MKPKTTTVTMRMIEEWVEELKRIARTKAYKQDKDITYQDIIKEALQGCTIPGYTLLENTLLEPSLSEKNVSEKNNLLEKAQHIGEEALLHMDAYSKNIVTLRTHHQLTIFELEGYRYYLSQILSTDDG